jgi:hypothetical protein
MFAAALAGNTQALRDTLARAMADVLTACQEIEQGHPRAAIGAVIPIVAAVDDANALLAAILILNRRLD